MQNAEIHNVVWFAYCLRHSVSSKALLGFLVVKRTQLNGVSWLYLTRSEYAEPCRLLLYRGITDTQLEVYIRTPVWNVNSQLSYKHNPNL